MAILPADLPLTAVTSGATKDGTGDLVWRHTQADWDEVGTHKSSPSVAHYTVDTAHKET